MWSVLSLAVALSLDGLGVGASYGARGIVLRPSSYVIVALCTAGLMSAAMLSGLGLSSLLSPSLAQALGGSVLIALGLWQGLQGWKGYLATTYTDPEKPLADFRLRPLGLAVRILRDPELADVDRSGDIRPGEAYALGLALGLDAFAAGLGAALAGFPFCAVLMVSLSCIAFLFLGTRLGRAWDGSRWSRGGFIVPALLLILIGVSRMKL